MRSLFIATSNDHKIIEVRSILGPDWQILSQKDTPLRLDVVESGRTFEANAAIKALAWASLLQSAATDLGAGWVLGDDSGLEVDALGGEPGIYSARYAALDSGTPGNSPDSDNTAKLLRRLSGVAQAQRTARFRCAIAVVAVPCPDPLSIHHFSGVCDGHILTAPSGTRGFGYDPVFVPDGESRSFAELGDEVKNRMSHRAKALAAARLHLLQN